MRHTGHGPLYTWLDVESVILRARYAGRWPEGVVYFVDPSGIHIEVTSPVAGQAAVAALRRWFGARFDDRSMAVTLEPAGSRERSLAVSIEEVEEVDLARRTLRPTFTHVALLPLPETPGAAPYELPPALPGESPVISAFYSFKGGVGRSTHALAFTRAVYDLGGPGRPLVLLVDADLEAPGLTWWLQDLAGEWRVSFLDLLALAQYDESPGRQETMTIVTQGLRQQLVTLETVQGRVKFFFLPAFRTEEQALRMPLRPEHVVRVPRQAWLLTDLLAAIGHVLEVSTVIVDLRAGYSEVASPFLFDPRVRRILVTTPASPSVRGTCSVLKQIRKLTPGQAEPDSPYSDPVVVISMVTSHDETAVLDAQTRLWEAYPGGYELGFPPAPLMAQTGQTISVAITTGEVVREQPDSPAVSTGTETQPEVDPISPPALRVEATAYADELLHLHDLRAAWERLSGTSVLRTMTDLAREWVQEAKRRAGHAEHSSQEHRSNQADRAELRQALERKAASWVYAESADADDFLRTGAWEQLARRFFADLPLAVVMGAKGAGKTFLFLQLLRLQTWEAFLEALQISPAVPRRPWAPVVPMLYPTELTQTDVARARLQACRTTAAGVLGHSFVRDRGYVVQEIHRRLRNPASVSEWVTQWLTLIGAVLEIDVTGASPLERLQEILERRDARVVVAIDGLEQVFDDIVRDERQQAALRALCQELPALLAEIPDRRLGLVVFVRKDLARAAITQNFGQFERLHQPYELRWNPEEALRLAVWLCKAADLTEPLGMSLQDFALEEAPWRVLEEALRPVWGYRLGRLTSREAITANWVIAALSDLNGRLQPRDVVRFFQFAARRAQEVTDYDTLYTDRLLPPAAVRYAVRPCSLKKVEEVQEEAKWVKGIIEKFRGQPDRRIPFRPEDFELTGEEVRLMKELGMVLEDEDKLYMPEIYRHGLGFRLDRGARPRVLTLMKRAFGSLF
ncbi:hypothetical protein DYI95_003375 [Thermaerobacter sp. PB12/4term]|uniref:KGGVGR-motif variant AAA ATPase n=1 Tax=Thermaerobacter sp. PB12/4term TaxID=2293838 RepID=UPI000E3ADC5B|nr:hypothetical protein [Thermaerobacter sp. PB12/4term]QIA26690.1 hypothetical protein DYI95_003375 [Thermaerobacter sp. PB12/4term]